MNPAKDFLSVNETNTNWILNPEDFRRSKIPQNNGHKHKQMRILYKASEFNSALLHFDLFEPMTAFRLLWARGYHPITYETNPKIPMSPQRTL